jgi:hypothetical protein
VLDRVFLPHSLGSFYTMICEFIGYNLSDYWSPKFFQYGNASLPDGDNGTDLLAVSTVAVRDADLQTSIWRVVD